MQYAIHRSAFETLRWLYDDAVKTHPACSLCIRWGGWGEHIRGVVVVGLYHGVAGEHAPPWRSYEGVRVSFDIPENIEGAPKSGVLCFRDHFFIAPASEIPLQEIVAPGA